MCVGPLFCWYLIKLFRVLAVQSNSDKLQSILSEKTRDKRKKNIFIKQKREYIMFNGRLPLQKIMYTKEKLQENTLHLSFGWGRVFLRISSLGTDIISFGLSCRILGLGNHILDCKGVLGGLVLH